MQISSFFCFNTHLSLSTHHLVFEIYCLPQILRYRNWHSWLLSLYSSLLADDFPPPWRLSLWKCCVDGHQLQFQSCWSSVGTDQGCSRCHGGPCPGHH